MSNETITTCPVCDHGNFSNYLTTKDYTVTQETFNLVKCSSCNFIFTNPRPKAESIGKFYSSDNYISHSGKSKTILDKVYLVARNITMRWKYKLITQYFATSSSILDYGCGTGEFLNYIKNKGWTVEGLEPNNKARQKANSLLNNKVYQNLKEVNNNQFRVITLWHVLEHIHDLNQTIQNLKKILSSDGVLIIAVPNPNSHDSQHYNNKWAGYDVPRHLWHFSQETMKSLLHKNGLKVVDIKPMKLDAYYVSLLSERYKNPNQFKLVSGFKAFMEGVLSNLYARKNKEHSSLIYIARHA